MFSAINESFTLITMMEGRTHKKKQMAAMYKRVYKQLKKKVKAKLKKGVSKRAAANLVSYMSELSSAYDNYLKETV